MVKEYFGTIYKSVRSLVKGMKVTGYYFTHPKEILTEEYPDNRTTLTMFERFKGEVIMPHNENNEHRCTGCQACEIACPNGTIKVITKQEINAEGKKKKAIDAFVYHLEMCTLCNNCVTACPSEAITMAPIFAHSVYDKRQLKKILNQPGSKIMEGVE